MKDTDIIRKFVNNETESWEWDDFITIRSKDPNLNKLKNFCNAVQNLYPVSQGDRGYCSNSGLSKLWEAAQMFDEGSIIFLQWLEKENRKI